MSGTSIAIAAKSTSGTVTITANNDQTIDTNLDVTVAQSNGDNWLTKNASVTVTVKNDDGVVMPPDLRLSSNKLEVRLDWNAVANATGYRVEWNTSDTWTSIPSNQMDTVGAVTTWSKTSGLTAGTYYFRVIALRTGYEDSPPSDVVSGTIAANSEDYDDDDDGLIEIETLAQLNAVRWDLDGDGNPSNSSNYTASGVFPNAEDNMGCYEHPATPTLSDSSHQNTGNPNCRGYELKLKADNRDFDTNNSGGPNSGDTYWNGGQGWLPIGATAGSLTASAYTGEFHGADCDRAGANCTQYTISNLHINRSGSTTVAHAGLFAELGSAAVVENLRLEKVDVEVATNATATTAADVYAGGVAGKSAASITGSYVEGSVKAVQSDNTNASPPTEGYAYAGGLVGHSTGAILSSYARATVEAEQAAATDDLEAYAGGLVAYQGTGGSVAASYSWGTVLAYSQSADDAIAEAGGLIGRQEAGSVKASYSHSSAEAKATATATDATLNAGGLVGHLQSGASIVASYSTGAPTTTGGASASVTANAGGLTGFKATSGTTTTNSYWDTVTSGTSTSASGTGKTTSELKTPDSYTYGNGSGIYSGWNIDVAGTSATDDPWDFGTTTQYPAVDYGLTAADQRATLTVAAARSAICETTDGSNTNACGSDNVISTTLTASIGAAQALPVTITIATNAAYTLSPASITINAGSTSGAAGVTITADNNKVDAADNALTIGGTTAQNWVSITGASLTIKDDDVLVKPTGLKLSVHGTNLQADWEAVTQAQNADSYTLQWHTADSWSGTPTGTKDLSGNASTTHKITSGLTSGTTYYFRVIAKLSGYDDSAPSDVVSTTPTTGTTDYDTDNDGLIEIETLAQLNAIRYDLDGDGDPSTANAKPTTRRHSPTPRPTWGAARRSPASPPTRTRATRTARATSSRPAPNSTRARRATAPTTPTTTPGRAGSPSARRREASLRLPTPASSTARTATAPGPTAHST